MAIDRLFMIIAGVIFLSTQVEARWDIHQMKKVQQVGVDKLKSKNADRYITVKGQKYRLIQSYNSKGLAQKTILISKKETQIKVDKNGDGRTDYWEIHRPGLMIRAEEPMKNIFQLIQIKKANPKGFDEVQLVYNAKKKKYSVVGRRFLPPKKYTKENIQVDVSGTCEQSEPTVKEAVLAWEKVLSNLSDAPSEIAERIEKGQNNLFSSSCMSGDFKESFPLIKDALTDVMASSEKAGGAKEPTYLSCLEKNGLQYHAARIEAKFYEHLEGSAGSSRTFSSLIKCQKSSDFGSYSSWWDEISIGKTKDELSSGVKSSNMAGETATGSNRYAGRLVANTDGPEANARKNYAKTLFHELLHSSEIENEGFVHSIEECCGDPQKSDSASCQAMRDFVTREREQKLSKQILSRSNPDQYEQLQSKISYEITDAAELNRFREGISQDIGSSIASADKKYAKILDDTSLDVSQREEKLNQYKKEVLQDLDQKISAQCERTTFATNVNKKTACADIKKSILEMTEKTLEDRGIDGVCLDPSRASRKSVSDLLNSADPPGFTPAPDSFFKKKIENQSTPGNTGAQIIWRLMVNAAFAAEAAQCDDIIRDAISSVNKRNEFEVDRSNSLGLKDRLDQPDVGDTNKSIVQDPVRAEQTQGGLPQAESNAGVRAPAVAQDESGGQQLGSAQGRQDDLGVGDTRQIDQITNEAFPRAQAGGTEYSGGLGSSSAGSSRESSQDWSAQQPVPAKSTAGQNQISRTRNQTFHSASYQTKQSLEDSEEFHQAQIPRVQTSTPSASNGVGGSGTSVNRIPSQSLEQNSTRRYLDGKEKKRIAEEIQSQPKLTSGHNQRGPQSVSTAELEKTFNRSFNSVIADLEKPDFQNDLMGKKIQVIDHKGRVHGYRGKDPAIKYVYSILKNRFVRSK
ncbi:MAG: hypothetical protein BroJett040_04340 [Oligoflexia bacterium]|nr:MAG: hypothetical protein BroJett040_04340 [Oligoflexia bacterium]